MQQWLIRVGPAWPENPMLTWIQRGDQGVEAADAASPPGFWPQQARNVLLILPASQVFLGRVKLPTRAAGKVRAILPYAVEDQLASDPEQVHVALGPLLPSGESVVGVVDKAWFRRLLARLDESSVQVTAAVPEHLLLPLKPGHWSMFWDGREGWLRTDAALAQTLDIGSAERPPAALGAALQEARAQGGGPAAVDLYRAPGALRPDLGTWATQLEIPIFDQGSEALPGLAQTTAGVALNLMQGMATGGDPMRTLWSKYRVAAILIAVILGVQMMATVADWWRLKHEAETLRTQMADIFRQNFPGAVVVDPVLQMDRQLKALRNRSGLATPGDFLVLLSQFAGSMAGHSDLQVQSLQYRNQDLSIELQATNPAAVNAVLASLRAKPVRVETPVVTPAGNGTHVKLRLQGKV